MMALSTTAKKKVLDLIKEHAIQDIYYSDFCNIIKSSRTKINNDDILNYLSEKAMLEIEKKAKLSTNKFSKMVFSMTLIITYSTEDDIEIDKITIKKVNQVLLKYNQYLQSVNLEADELIKQKLEELKEELEKNYSEVLKETESPEETNKLVKELELLKSLITDYEKKITDIEKNQITLEKELKQSRITSKNLENTKQNLQITITALKEKINFLNHELKKYQNQIQVLLKETKEKEFTITSFTELNNSLKKEIQILNDKNQELTKQVTELIKKISVHEENIEIENQTQQIRNIILTELYKKPNSIESLINILNKNGYSETYQTINEHLNALKNRVKIEGPLFESIPPVYKIDTKLQKTPNPIYLPSLALDNEIDILLIADLHKEFQKDLLVKMDIVYNYASANNIYYIFNLGDNFHNMTKYNNGIEDLQIVEQWIQELSDCIPQNTGIYLLNVGGNHDQKFLLTGIDPLSKLQQYRPDFINLGYNHVNIILGNQLKTDNCLALHHPVHRINETIGQSFSENSNVKNYLLDYYRCNQNNSITRDKVYCDFLAHIHRSKLDICNSYCQVPSYTRDRVANGAWHLKIYFDSQKNINYIIFIPLIIMENQLKPVSEIPYQKIKEIKRV